MAVTASRTSRPKGRLSMTTRSRKNITTLAASAATMPSTTGRR
jgi:hypothetical protein